MRSIMRRIAPPVRLTIPLDATLTPPEKTPKQPLRVNLDTLIDLCWPGAA